MSVRKVLTGLIQNTDLRLSNRRNALYKQVETELRAACTDLNLEYIIPGDNNEFTDEQILKLENLEIVLCDPRIFRRPDVLTKFKNIKWIHGFWAGVDILTRHHDTQKSPPFMLTRNGEFFDGQMVEYVMGMILMRERHLLELFENNKNKLWKQELPCRQLSNLSLGIVGFGAIGKNLAKVAKAFQMTVWGLVRENPVVNKNNSDEAEYKLTTSLPELLSSCDYICSILPSTPSTDGIFDGDVLSNCQHKKSVFINIGRGNVVHESTIINALDKGWISHAILDVFETEPLPAPSPLWAHPNITVTPHQAAIEFDPKLFADNFTRNYHHYINGEPMEFVVDWNKGY